MSDFPWVDERARCTAFEVLRRIREGVEADIKARNAQFRAPVPMVFKFREEPNPRADKFEILCLGQNLQDAVTFEAPDNREIIATHGHKRTEATLGLNKEGRCMIVVNGEELENWQFRKLVLDDFFRF